MKYFLIAGEASGDMHGARLMHELNAQDAQAEFVFLGGDLMQAEGGTMVKHYRNMAFMGVVNVVLNLNKVLNNINECKKAILQHQPDVVILIDYPGFNLKIAEFVKTHTQIPVFYYIAPKLWAWKSWRIKSIKKYVDEMFTIFPFETEYFRNLGYEVRYVGNPTVDAIAEYHKNNNNDDNRLVDNKLIDNSTTDNKQKTIAILAGSREQEIKGCLPTMIAAAQEFPDYKIIVAGAPGIESDFYYQLMPKEIELTQHHTYTLLEHANVAIVNSGTATLETALIGTPQVIVYHVFGGRFASILKKILIKIPYVSLVNLIGEDEVCKELLAHHFTKENVVCELKKLTNDKNYIDTMKRNYQSISQRLGDPGTAERCAKMIVELMATKKILL